MVAEEVVMMIFRMLPPIVLARDVSMVCRQWRELSLDPSLWRELPVQVLFDNYEKICASPISFGRLEVIIFFKVTFKPPELVLYSSMGEARYETRNLRNSI